MTKHIGIVAVSAEGAALCYRTICVEGAELLGPHAHPEISLHTIPLSRYMVSITNGDWQGVGELMFESARKLVTAGAELLICPDNTVHEAFEHVDLALQTSTPWLHIAESVADVAIARGYRKVGILGTRFLMEGPVYPSRLDAKGIKWQIPLTPERERVNQIIFDELVYGRTEAVSRKYFCDLIQNFKEDNCEAVVLGCTEIPLLISDDVSPLPCLDSTRLLARAALKVSIGTNHRG
jgi:aspartate racemase